MQVTRKRRAGACLISISIRSQFPALPSGAIFLDNPGGTQVAQQTLKRMTDYLVHTNANHEGAFKTSRESDAIVDASRDRPWRISSARRGPRRSSSGRT